MVSRCYFPSISTTSPAVCKSTTTLPVSTFECLKRHDISPELRSQMINWMIEVFWTYDCDEQCFFKAVYTMDLYYLRTHKSCSADDVHLTAVAVIYIASKAIDYFPLKIEIVCEKIAHEAFTEQEILSRESEIMKALRSRSNFRTVYDCIVKQLAELSRAFPLSKELIKQLKDQSIYLSMMCLHDYDMLKYS